jgi:phosphoglycerol transferase MdoB-like AlkP superfamily enzyme
MDFDRAISAFIRDFTYSGRIDDVVIIIFGDHFAKGAFSDQGSLDALCENEDYECLSTPFIVWHHATQGIEIDKTSNALDILPTTLDIMGVEFDSSLALGKSIFSPTYEGFYYNAWGDIIVGELEYNQLDNTLNGVPLHVNEALDPKIVDAIEFIQLAPSIVENNYFATDEWTESQNGVTN